MQFIPQAETPKLLPTQVIEKEDLKNARAPQSNNRHRRGERAWWSLQRDPRPRFFGPVCYHLLVVSWEGPWPVSSHRNLSGTHPQQAPAMFPSSGPPRTVLPLTLTGMAKVEVGQQTRRSVHLTWFPSSSPRGWLLLVHRASLPGPPLRTLWKPGVWAAGLDQEILREQPLLLYLNNVLVKNYVYSGVPG